MDVWQEQDVDGRPSRFPQRVIETVIVVLVVVMMLFMAAVGAAVVVALLGSTASASPVRPGVVRVSVSEGGGVSSHGSGAIVATSADAEWSYVLTAAHVVRDQQAGDWPLRVTTGSYWSQGRTLWVDSTWDLAVVLAGNLRCDPVPIRVDRPAVGEWVTTAGFGRGDYREVTGQVTGYDGSLVSPATDYLRASVVNRDGDSGGPIFDAAGQLVAVAWGARTDDGTRGTVGERIKRVWETQCSSSRCTIARPRWVRSRASQPRRMVVVPPQQPVVPLPRPPAAAPAPATTAPPVLPPKPNTIVGPVGPIGPQGVPGNDGKDGKDGKDGADGKAGAPANMESIELRLSRLEKQWEAFRLSFPVILPER